MARRRQAHKLLGGGGAHVRQLLLARRVDLHVVAAGVKADDHAVVDLDAGADEHLAALLQRHQRVLGCGALAVRDQRAVLARADLAVPGLEALQHVVQLAGAAGLREELGAEADQAARRDDLLDADPAGAVVDHLLHAALADAEHLDDDAGVLLGDVDRQALHRLVALAVDDARDDLRLADGQLEALATHRLDEHGQLQLAATLDLPGIRALRGVNAQRHVADELLLEAQLDHRGGQLLAALADQRGGVDADRHGQARLVDRDHGQRAGVLDGGDRLADGDLWDARDGDDVAGAGLIGGEALELLRDVELSQLDVLDRAVGAAPGDGLALAHRAVVDAAEREAAHVRRRVEVGDERLQRVVRIVLRRGHVLENRVEQRLEVLVQLIGAVVRGVTGAGVRVDDREVDLLLGGVEVEEQGVRLVEHLCDARVGAVHLVDHEDHGQVRLERLA